MTDLVTSYFEWFKSQFVSVKKGSYTEITTAFLDRHNDKIQIYAIKNESGYLLTDFGETLSDLFMSGVSLDKGKRKVILEGILKGFGVTQKDDELTITAEQSNQALRMNNLIQAILSVNDLFCLAQPTVYHFCQPNRVPSPLRTARRCHCDDRNYRILADHGVCRSCNRILHF